MKERGHIVLCSVSIGIRVSIDVGGRVAIRQSVDFNQICMNISLQHDELIKFE